MPTQGPPWIHEIRHDGYPRVGMQGSMWPAGRSDGVDLVNIHVSDLEASEGACICICLDARGALHLIGVALPNANHHELFGRLFTCGL
jgi:hypothetical protein